jgi:hypothetical protein
VRTRTVAAVVPLTAFAQRVAAAGGETRDTHRRLRLMRALGFPLSAALEAEVGPMLASAEDAEDAAGT